MWVMCATNQTWWCLNLPKSAEAPQTAYDDDQRRMEKLWKIGVLQVFLPEKRGLLNIQWLIVILYLVEFSIKCVQTQYAYSWISALLIFKDMESTSLDIVSQQKMETCFHLQITCIYIYYMYYIYTVYFYISYFQVSNSSIYFGFPISLPMGSSRLQRTHWSTRAPNLLVRGSKRWPKRPGFLVTLTVALSIFVPTEIWGNWQINSWWPCINIS
jgi:hypothetical protein